MMKCLLLLSTFLVLAHGAEECMNTENSVSVTSDTDNICPMQSVTARCVVNTVSQTGNTLSALIWRCDYNSGSIPAEAFFFCTSSASVIPFECNSGRVNLTSISCTCNNSVLTSDATFLATRGSELLTCAFYSTSDQVEIHGTVSFGIKDPLTPVLSLNSSYTYDVENNSFRNVTIQWSSSGSEQYQYRVSISSPNSDPVTITTSATMINVTLEIGVDYSITVTAERCSGSVKSKTSEPFLVILPDVTSYADSSLYVVGLVFGIVAAIMAVGLIVVWVAVGLFGVMKKKRTTRSLVENIEISETSDQQEFDVEVIIISGPSTPVVTTHFLGEMIETSDQQEMEETQNTYNYNGQEIRGLCATENMLVCSDKVVQDDERGIVIGFERVEKRLIMKWKITGLNTPRGVTVDSNGKFVYVVESGNNRILKFNIENCECVRESPGSLMFILPRGIIAKNKWIFVCDTGKNRIQILDEDLNFHSIIKTSEDDIINAPNDIECIFDENSKSYTLYVATNVWTIVVLQVYLDGGKTIAAGKKIMQLNNMEIDLQTNIMRSICIIEKRYIFVTEMCINGRIICLDLENEGRYVKELTRKSSEATCPTMIAHCGNTIIYCEIYEGKHAGCHIQHFDIKSQDGGSYRGKDVTDDPCNMQSPTSLKKMEATISNPTAVDSFIREQHVHTRNIPFEPLVTSIDFDKYSQTTLDHITTRDFRHETVEILQVQKNRTESLLPSYSGDPYNTAEHIPRWLHPVTTLTDCTCDGRIYYDEHNDFRLEIPMGAIPEGGRVTIDIGVALYGPFQYPKGLRPVSPVFWACVRGHENFHFLKPVKITIEHCLSLDRHTDTHSLGLTFLKGDHSKSTNQKYCLQRFQGEKCEFIANDNHAVLYTNHFCYQCIASNISKEVIDSADFALLVLTPKEMVYSKPMKVYFFVIFLLEACLKTIEEQIEKEEGKKFYTTTLVFRYPKGKDNPVIRMQWEITLPGEWGIESLSTIEISYKDVDFYGMNQDHLKAREKCGLYPPRFVVSIDGSRTTMKAVANFTFSGALINTTNDDLKYPLQLLPEFPQPVIQGISLKKLEYDGLDTVKDPEPSTLNLDDLNEVFVAVVSLSGRWNKLGLVLGLHQTDLSRIKIENSGTEDCLIVVLTNWLNQMYNVPKFGEPSWPALVKAVNSPAGGRNPTLALDIAQKYSILPD